MRKMRFDEERDSHAPRVPFYRAEKLRVKDRPAAARVLRTVGNLGRVGLTADEIGWLFDLPAELVDPVIA